MAQKDFSGLPSLPKLAAAVVFDSAQQSITECMALFKEKNIPVFLVAAQADSGKAQQVLKKYRSNISLLESPTDLGPNGNLNCAVMAALSTGCEYILLMQGEVQLENDCIEQLVRFLDQHPDFVFVTPYLKIKQPAPEYCANCGLIDFSRRFFINPEPDGGAEAGPLAYMPVDFANPYCLMVRAHAVQEFDIMDWHYYNEFGAIDWTVRLREAFGRGARLDSALASLAKIPINRPLSESLYYAERNLNLFISKVYKKKWGRVLLRRHLSSMIRNMVYSWVIGKDEIALALKHALMDACKKRYGKLNKSLQFARKRPNLDAAFFEKHNIRRVLLDFEFEALNQTVIETLRRFGGERIKVDVLCDSDKVSCSPFRNFFSAVYHRKLGKLSVLKAFFKLKLKRYDLVISNASHNPANITAFTGKRAACFADEAFWETPNRPFMAIITISGLLFIRKVLAPLLVPLLSTQAERSIPPEKAWPLLRKIGIIPEIGHPWSRIRNSHFDAFKNDSALNGHVTAPRKGEAYAPMLEPQQFLQKHLGPVSTDVAYDKWCHLREQWAPLKYQLQHQGVKPLFSVLVPVCDPKVRWLEACIDSVRCQTYVGWELILADDASINNQVKDTLKRASTNDARILVNWGYARSGISNCTNRAAQMASGDYLLFLDHDDILDPYALAAFAQAIMTESIAGPVDVLYADEDLFDDDGVGMRRSPHFKPQYSPELHLATNYIHHPVVIRNDLFKRLNGLRSLYDGSQDHDLLLRAEEVCRPFVHVPDVLYHMRVHQGSLASGPQAKPEAHQRDRVLIAEALKRRKIDATVKPAQDGLPGFSVIKRKLADMPSITVLIIPDGPTSPNKAGQFWQQKCLFGSPEQSVAQQVNDLALKAESDVLVIASSEIRPCEGWTEAIIPHILRNEIGMVTGKVAYHDDSLYSCGLVIGIGGAAGRWHQDWPVTATGFSGWLVLDHEVSAVPWRFMGIRRKLFLGQGMFDTNYHYHGFDVDLALKLRTNLNLRHLAIPGARVAFTKDFPKQDHEKWHIKDLMRLWRVWGRILREGDPYLNPNFTLYPKGAWVHDASEYYLRSCGWFTAYDEFTARLLRDRFPN